LQRIVPLPPGTHAGGEYDGAAKEMRMPVSILTTPAAGAFDPAEATFVLGHELRHGHNHAATVQAYRRFNGDVAQIAQSHAAVHDYTQVTATLIAANRRDEAGAEIAGWNAVVGMVKASHPHPTLEDIYKASPFRMGDFIDRSASPPYRYSLKPNLSLNPDLTLAQSSANLEAMGANYFDKPNSRLGYNGNSDYANYYGAYAVGVAGRQERQYATTHGSVVPQMTFDLGSLRLSESQMEQNGIDLGTNHNPIAYLDRSVQPPALHHFDHTKSTHTHVPVAARVAEEAVVRPDRDPRAPEHPDHVLFQQAQRGVHALDAALGRAPDAASERMALNLTVLAKEHRLRIDHVVLGQTASATGENVFVVQGGLDDPARALAYMKTEAALHTPVETALQNLEAINRSQVLRSEVTALQAQPHPMQEPLRMMSH